MKGLFNTARNIVTAVVLITVVAYIGILRYQNRFYENTIARLENKPGFWKKIVVSPGRIDTVYSSKSIKRDIPLEGNVTLRVRDIPDTIIFQDTFIVVMREKIDLKGQTYGLTRKIFFQLGYSYPVCAISPQIGLKLLYWHDFNVGILASMQGYGLSLGWHIYHQPLEVSLYSMKSWVKNDYNVGLALKIDIWDLSR